MHYKDEKSDEDDAKATRMIRLKRKISSRNRQRQHQSQISSTRYTNYMDTVSVH